MVNNYVLDTNVLSELGRSRPNPVIVDRLTRAPGATMASVTWHELRFGVRRMAPGPRRDSLDELVHELATRFPILPYDQSAAEWHASQRARLEQLGRVPPYQDGQIAAIAATRGLTLVTRNVRDFAGFTDLRVESWWSDPEPT